MKLVSSMSANKLIVETYKEDRALKTTVQNGFAMVSQKVSVKPLRLLVDATISVGTKTLHVPKGALIYIKESSLQSQPWAKVSLQADGIEGDFMIVDPVHMEFFANEGF